MTGGLILKTWWRRKNEEWPKTHSLYMSNMSSEAVVYSFNEKTELSCEESVLWVARTTSYRILPAAIYWSLKRKLVAKLSTRVRRSFDSLSSFPLRTLLRDFPGGPVVRNPPCNTGDTGSTPGQGTKISRVHMPLLENPESLCAQVKDPVCQIFNKKKMLLKENSSPVTCLHVHRGSLGVFIPAPVS